jgi:hypothetical protein
MLVIFNRRGCVCFVQRLAGTTIGSKTVDPWITADTTTPQA